MRKRVALLALIVVVAGCGTHDRTQELEQQKLTLELMKAQNEQLKEQLAASKQKDDRFRALEKKYMEATAEIEKVRKEKSETDGSKAVVAARAAGRLATAKGDFDGAIAEYTKVIQFAPNQPDAFYHRGWAYYDRAIAQPEKHKEEEALPDFNQAIRLNPEASEPYMLRARIYDDMGQVGRAVADYTQALQGNLEDSRRALALLFRGLDFRQQEEFDKAIADFSEAIRMDPLYEEAYYRRGGTYAAKANRDCEASGDPKGYQGNEDIKKAIADFHEVLRLHPSHADSARKLKLAEELIAAPEPKRSKSK